jgi:hypothetical protein
MLSVFLTFFVTLAIFPAVVASVKSNGEIPLSGKRRIIRGPFPIMIV